MNIVDLLIHGSEVQSPKSVVASGPVPQLTTPATHDLKRLAEINSPGLSLYQIKRSASEVPLPESTAKKQLNFPANIPVMPAYGASSPNHAYSAHQSASVTSMQGGSVLPAIEEPHRHLDPGQPPVSATIQPGPPGSNGLPPSQTLKRAASEAPRPEEPPAKRQSRWTTEEDNLTIKLRGQGMKWDDIAKHLTGRSSISCRLRYQNYLEKRAVWDEEKKDKLARLYARYKDEIWQKVATEMGIPWRSAESMHWQLGEQEMSGRANAPVFQPHHPPTECRDPDKTKRAD